MTDIVEIQTSGGVVHLANRSILQKCEYFNSLLSDRWGKSAKIMLPSTDSHSFNLFLRAINYGPSALQDLTQSEIYMLFQDAHYFGLEDKYLHNIFLEENNLLNFNNIVVRPESSGKEVQEFHIIKDYPIKLLSPKIYFCHSINIGPPSLYDITILSGTQVIDSINKFPAFDINRTSKCWVQELPLENKIINDDLIIIVRFEPNNFISDNTFLQTSLNNLTTYRMFCDR